MEEDMVEQVDGLNKNESWDLVQLPTERKIMGRKWLFKRS